jgi:hypothetical protein
MAEEKKKLTSKRAIPLSEGSTRYIRFVSGKFLLYNGTAVAPRVNDTLVIERSQPGWEKALAAVGFVYVLDSNKDGILCYNTKIKETE